MYNLNLILDETSFGRQKSMLKDIIPDIIEPVISSISKELKLKNEKMKGHILQLLTTLALVCPNELVYFLGPMMKDLEISLKENNVRKINNFIRIMQSPFML